MSRRPDRSAIFYPANVKSMENCKKIVDTAAAAMGIVDILVSNAAYQMKNDISELSEEQWLHTFDTNIHPSFYFSKYALPHMKSGSTIINNASINAYIV